jgi:hypothetical protein
MTAASAVAALCHGFPMSFLISQKKGELVLCGILDETGPLQSLRETLLVRLISMDRR